MARMEQITEHVDAPRIRLEADPTPTCRPDGAVHMRLEARACPRSSRRRRRNQGPEDATSRFPARRALSGGGCRLPSSLQVGSPASPGWRLAWNKPCNTLILWVFVSSHTLAPGRAFGGKAFCLPCAPTGALSSPSGRNELSALARAREGRMPSLRGTPRLPRQAALFLARGGLGVLGGVGTLTEPALEGAQATEAAAM